jgi:hypothetical protein
MLPLYDFKHPRIPPTTGEARTSDKIQSAHALNGHRIILLNRPKKNGGACRDRTDDLKLAKLPLSQLS